MYYSVMKPNSSTSHSGSPKRSRKTGAPHLKVPGNVVRRSTEENETSIRLLDSAEVLFGEHGYDGIGMRELAAAARVNLGAATYYFGSKKELYIAVFMRRFRPSNAEQLTQLQQAQAEAGGSSLPVARIVDCMVRPTYALGMAYPSFSALLTRNLMAPPEFLQAALSSEFEPTVQAYVMALHKALPYIPIRQLRGRLMFAMGSLLMFSAQIGRLGAMDHLPPLEHVFGDLARFISAGLQAPAGSAKLDGAACIGASVHARQPMAETTATARARSNSEDGARVSPALATAPAQRRRQRR